MPFRVLVGYYIRSDLIQYGEELCLRILAIDDLSRNQQGLLLCNGSVGSVLIDTPSPYKGEDSTFNDSPLDSRLTPTAQEGKSPVA